MFAWKSQGMVRKFDWKSGKFLKFSKILPLYYNQEYGGALGLTFGLSFKVK